MPNQANLFITVDHLFHRARRFPHCLHDMTATFQHEDVQFVYPENWELSQQTEDQSPWEVSLEIPGGGFWSVYVFPVDFEPLELLENAQNALKDQYEDVEFQAPEQTNDPFPMVSVEAHFYCLDFLVTALIQVVSTPSHTFVIACQAESREFDSKQDVFRAITASLLSGKTT